MTPTNPPQYSIDDVIFNIEDYVGGNIEGIDKIDRMGFTVFLRRQLEAVIYTQVLELIDTGTFIEPITLKEHKLV